MDDKLSFKIAHGVVDDFEKKIKEEVQNIKRITTHIETDLDTESSVGREEFADQTFLERIKKMALSIEGVSNCDEISLVYVKNELHITLTIKINPLSIKSDKRSPDSITSSSSSSSSSDPDDSISVEKAHDISTQVQNLLLENTNAARVIVHAEPV